MNWRLTRVVLAVLFAGSMLFYVQRVLIPYQQQDAAAHDRPRGNLSDLYPRWLGARELLLNGRDPYSAEVTREIQAGYYGRPLDAARPGDPTDQQGFAYPVYVVFLLAPTVTLPFSVVQETFFWLLLLVVAASGVLWLLFLRWRPSATTIGLMLLLTAASFPVVQALKLQQLSLLVAGFIALAAALLTSGYLIPSGILMAFAMIKPQLAVPVGGWLFLWALSDWPARRRYLLSFGLTIAGLLAASEWVLPGWVVRFREAIAAYRMYTGNIGSVLDSLAGPGAGRILALSIVVIFLIVCWRSRGFSSAAPQFVAVTCLVLAATVVIVPTIAPYNQVLLLPAVLNMARHWPKFMSATPGIRAAALSCGAILTWPWIGACGLMLLSLVDSPERVQRFWGVPLISSLFIPLAVLAMQGLSLKYDSGKE